MFERSYRGFKINTKRWRFIISFIPAHERTEYVDSKLFFHHRPVFSDGRTVWQCYGFYLFYDRVWFELMVLTDKRPEDEFPPEVHLSE